MLISDRELSIIICNLITNAIEAVEKVKYGEKYIGFYVKEGKIFNFITVKNSCISDEVNFMGEKIITSKKDKKNHGFGLKNIKNIVEKNYGEIEYKIEKNIFIVEIRMKK